MKTMVKSFVLLLVGALLLTACSTKAPGTESDSKKKGKGDLKIGLSISTLNNPFFVTLKEGAQKEAKKAGVQLKSVDAQDDSAKQANDIEDLIQQGVDVLLVNPTDSAAISSAIESANSAGIPVITVDRSAEGGKVVSHIASDNVEGGKMAGEYIAKQLKGKGNVVELEGISGSSAARERGEGFHKAVDNEKGMKVVAKQTASFDRAKGLNVMENILQGNKKVDAVFAHNDEMALGALQALEAAGLKDVIVVGFDATDDAQKAIKDGKMAATVAQKPDMIGSEAVQTAVKVSKKEKVEKFIPVDLDLITK
ncbi:ribose ABC transporter substrate-binding protein RbsB [Fictibacillus enclensis]|uniref:ribose ABC transporter substrate-binding protein RbsB n=1 Tax=Fictibacillus enclensis TaxID=1017270 RepID=UPI0025A0298C|nr:ribose ABC transporter substrate-binding protein RbsB [Fictibacillus enclensis]MDM5201208.1 ribose ABC transporter substrate-binding protein RbsB [Fictibacillus enclensis]